MLNPKANHGIISPIHLNEHDETLRDPIFNADSDFAGGRVQFRLVLTIFLDDALTHENLHMSGIIIRCSCLWD